MGDMYTNPPQSRNEAILRATIDGVEYTAPPQSRIEDLLLELKAAIEGGGGGGTTVIANPSGEATADLEKLQVGTTIYDVEGSEVIANPSGTSSTDLTKLSVDGTIYGIPQGGTVTVDDEMSNSSTNPVQNKVITAALGGKVDALAGYGLSENDYTDTDAAKVAALGTASTKSSTNAVTEDSTDLVESGAVYTALATKQDTISDLSTIRSGASAGATALQPSDTYGLVKNDGTIATMANAPIQGSGNPITSGGLYNEEKGIFNVMGITGALNYLKIEAVTTEVHGVTFTVNANKTIKGNGLATEDIDFPIASQTQLQNIISTKGLLKLVGCPASGSLNSYYLYFVDDRTNETIDHGEGATIAWEGITTTPLYIHVKSGTQLNNVLFSPMVVDRNVISDYVEGVATNKDLEAAVDGILNGTTLDSFGDVETALASKANTSALADYYTRAEQAVEGAYNLFDIDLPRTNGASVTSPVTSSETGSSLTVSNSTAGTYKEADYVGLSFPKNADLKAIFGATVTSGKGKFYIDGSNDGTNWTNITSSDLITATGSFTVPFNTGNYTSHRIRWYCTFDVSETGSVTYTDIMIVYASNTPSAYVPYAKTNKQLTDIIPTLFPRSEQAEMGAYNRMEFPYYQVAPTFTKDGVTFATDDNGIITGDSSGVAATGTAEAQLHGRLSDAFYVPMYLPIGKYKVGIGCSDAQVGIQLATTYNSGWSALTDIVYGTNWLDFEITADTHSDFKLSDGSVLVAVYIRSSNSTKVWNNIKIYPMIYSQGTPDNFPFVPFAKTNKQLTDDVATIPTVSVSHTGTASSTGVRKQQITVNNVSYDVDGSAYMEQSVTLSTSATTDVTFTNAILTANSVIDVGTSKWGVFPTNVDAETTVGTCVVTMPKVDTAITVTVRIYVK